MKTEVYIDTMEADWRKEALRDIINSINAEYSFDGEDGGFLPVVRRLDFGDFVAGDLGLEFKEPGDFINSIRDKRLFDQAMGLRMNFKNPRIVVNCAYGDLFNEEIRRGFHPNAIRALIPSLIFKYKVEVDFTGGRGKKAFKSYMEAYLRKALTGEVIVPHLPVRPSADPKDHMRAIISCFPGLGPKKVEQVMGKFTSLKDFIDNPGKMIHTRGWGNATIRKIEDVINNTKGDWWDTETSPDGDDIPEKKPINGIPITKYTEKYVEGQTVKWGPPATDKEERKRDMLRY